MIPEQRYHEDVAIGMELPPLTRGPFTIRDLVKFAAATDDYSEIHFDESVVRARGLPAPVVHGPLKSALLAQMLTGWIGPAGALKRLACQYRQMDVVGETLTCRGKVTGKTVRDGESIVECEVWTENGRGEVTTRGTAILILPTRNSP
jgi:acyl dehydratase